MKPIKSILIANRGEIAGRIIRTCRRLGIRTVAVYSEADREQPFVKAADEAIRIGPQAAARSYLNQEAILQAARRSRTDAIHPGYGFLSENATFARRCQEAGIRFIGPEPAVIDVMGSKSRAKRIMQKHGVPVIPGYQGEDQSVERLEEEMKAIGFPVLLKAAAGGGGKGMRIVREASEAATAITAAKREALNSFGDEELLIEKYFPAARHIEFQIFGDRHGHVVHLLERECSIQRRYQKVLEESPSPVLNEANRQMMGEAAVNAAKAIDYHGAGTVEFIYPGDGEFYFLEVNTRLQVEHPVTEMITGLDLVELQIAVAEGKALPFRQKDIKGTGYALECRLYAEDARNNFLPVTGKVLQWAPQPLEGVRYESAVESGSEIGIHYDPMIAKVIAHGPDRLAAIRRMEYALGQLSCLGLTTNLPFLLQLLRHEKFPSGDYHTQFIEQEMSLEALYDYPETLHHHAAIALTLHRWSQRRQKNELLQNLPRGWRNNFYQPQQEQYRIVETDWKVEYRANKEKFDFTIGETPYDVRLIESAENQVRFEANEAQFCFALTENDQWYFMHIPGTGQIIAQAYPRFPEAAGEQIKGGYEAPMPGEVVEVLVQAGQSVKSGDKLLVLSSMKMENLIAAEASGTVEEIFVAEGQHVEAGMLLLKMTND